MTKQPRICITLSLLTLLVSICGLARGVFAQSAGTSPDPFIFMYGHHDGAGVSDAFREIMPPLSVVEGTSTDADFIKELRDSGRVYAAHVINPVGESAAQLLARWRAPFENNLGGQLPGGYDAIAIDELHGSDSNSTAHSAAVVDALGQLRALYPDKKIYAAATWHYGSNAANYSDQLAAVNTHTDMLMLEAYIREGNPSYGWLTSWADNLKATVPGILNKSVYGLYVSQNGYVADDTTNVGFWGHLDEQFHRIRNDADAATMPGVMFWVYYRSKQDLTPDYVSRLVDHYYTQNNTSYFGDGNTAQLIANPQFETNTSGWTLNQGAGGTVQRFNYSSVSFEADHDDYGQASHGSYGLKTIRGSTPNTASLEMSGLDTDMIYTVSAWVMAEQSNRHAKLAIIETDGTPIESMTVDNVGTPPDWYAKWNEWSRIAFNFRPTSDTVDVVLSDEPAAAGTALYWDFVELEEAFPAEDDPVTYWTNLGPGVFSNGNNWSTGVKPGASDNVEFHLDATYGVIFQASESSQSVLVDAGNVSFVIGTYTYTLGDLIVDGSGYVNIVGSGLLSTGHLDINSGFLNFDLESKANLQVTSMDRDYFEALVTAGDIRINGDIVTDEFGNCFIVNDDTLSLLLKKIPGDADGNGRVDAADAVILAANWQTQSGATWSDGDFNYDGRVNDADATLLAANWQSSETASPAVPEPNACLLLGIACLMLLALNKKLLPAIAVLMLCWVPVSMAAESRVNSLGMQMICVEPGSFQMGSINDIPADRPELSHGLRGMKFANSDFTLPNAYIELTSTDVQWRDKYKRPWIARLKGRITAPATGNVIFTADADKGIRLVIADKTLINAWDPDVKTQQMQQYGLETRRGVIRMEKNKKYPIVIELWVDRPDARLRLLWEWEGHGKELVPIEALEPTAAESGQRLLSELSGPFTSPYGDSDERPVRTVRISRPFWISRKEITAEEYRRFKPDHLGRGAAHGISWHDATEFCKWLSKKEGKTYRLATEAEWEYCCRAGARSWFGTGDSKPRQGMANAWGIEGMNVKPPEWVLDWYAPYPDGDEVDPLGPASGFAKVVRGGPIHDGHPPVRLIDFDAPYFYRSANRAAVEPIFPPKPSDVPAKARMLAGKLFRDANLRHQADDFYVVSLKENFGPESDYHGCPGWIWSARVAGTLNAPVTGKILFRAEVHEGIRLKIDGKTVIDGWGIEKPRQGSFAMQKGKKYRFVVEIFETHNRGKLTLKWSWPGQPESVVPMTVFDEQEIPPMRIGGPIGFRVVQADLPDTRPQAYEPPFSLRCVKQTTQPAAHGPDAKRPWFKMRPILPIPPEDIPLEHLKAAGLEGMGPHHEAPALASCANGDLLAIFYSAPIRFGEYYPHMPFIVTRLRCGSEEWDMPEVIHHQADLVGASSLLWREGEKLWMIFGGIGLHKAPFRWTTSTDNGATWAPVQIPRIKGAVGDYSPQPISTMLRDRKGTLYLSCDGHIFPPHLSNSLLWASDDNGRSWYDTGGRTHARHSPFVLLEDGITIMAHGGKNTNYDGFQAVSYSTDGGKHWRREKSRFPMTWTKQRPSLLRLQSGRLFFASDWQKSLDGWQPPGIGKHGAYVALSDDDGKSWHVKTLEMALPHEKHDVPRWLLEEHIPWHRKGTIGYSVATQTPNGMIHLVTTTNHPAQHFEMNEAWILSDKSSVRPSVPKIVRTMSFEEQYPNGRLKAKWQAGIGTDGTYLLHGEQKHYFENGQLHYQVAYDRGRKTGAETLFCPGGSKHWSWNHRKDGMSTWTQWWSNGVKKAESTWRQSRCHGIARCWTTSGKLLSRIEFQNGHPVDFRRSLYIRR